MPFPPRPLVAFCWLLLSATSLNFAAEGDRTRFEPADTQGVTAFRDAHAIYLELQDEDLMSVNVPRIAAPLTTVEWVGNSDSTSAIKVQPEPEFWTISWESRPQGAKTLALRLADKPQLLSELTPVEAAGDGSFFLPAHFARTSGEKIRYEPQTYKNTVGYWVGKDDQATWTINVQTPGKFNVAILQGCGAGQGGSQASISFQPMADLAKDNNTTEVTDSNGAEAAKLDFEVLETGHFQNFRWRHLGEVEIDQAGRLSVTVAPTAIKKNALMDIRAIHLVRLPAIGKRR